MSRFTITTGTKGAEGDKALRVVGGAKTIEDARDNAQKVLDREPGIEEVTITDEEGGADEKVAKKAAKKASRRKSDDDDE